MSTSRITIAAMVLIGLAPAWTAYAQFGNPGLSSSFGSGSFGGNTYGVGASPGNSSGTFGSRTFGTSLSPHNRTLAGRYPASQMNNLANVGQVFGNQGVTQGNRNGQLGDGSQYSGVLANAFSGGLANQELNLGDLGGIGINLNNSTAYNPQQQQGSMQPKAATLETARKADFEYPLMQGTAATTALTNYLERSLKDRITVPLTAAVQGRTVILMGAVATEHDRILAEKLALLEPGVEAVQNELLVRSKLGSELPAPR